MNKLDPVLFIIVLNKFDAFTFFHSHEIFSNLYNYRWNNY